MKIQILRIAVIVSMMCVGIEAMRSMDPGRQMRAKTPKATEGDDWSYGGDTGPDTWADNYPACGDPLQTPIDLPAADDLTLVGPAPLTLEGYDKIPKGQYFVHDGFSGKLLSNYKTAKNTPSLSGCLLNDTFTFLQLHFHWGESNDVGSEHTIDGEASPLEIHFVHQSDAGALAVLGVMTYIDVENPRDSVLYPLWKCFAEMENPGDWCKLEKKNRILIQNLLPSDTSRFYRYLGSTTTPPCLANVIWTVFEDKLPISAADVALLRTWRDADDNLLLKNYRPIQDTGDRKILLVEQ